MLNLLINIGVGLASAIGLGVAVWSYFDTRKKYFDEYVKRKRRD